jgi:hypothetical protein
MTSPAQGRSFKPVSRNRGRSPVPPAGEFFQEFAGSTFRLYFMGAAYYVRYLWMDSTIWT